MDSLRLLPPGVRALLSKAGSLLFLFQRAPLVRMIFPEARLLADAGLSGITRWTVATFAGLGAYDTVAGATEVTQVLPSAGSLTVPAAVGSNLVFVYQATGSPNVAASWSVSEPLPTGLAHITQKYSAVDTIAGVPAKEGRYVVTATAWQNSNFSGGSMPQDFTIVVGPAIIETQPASILAAQGRSATLSVQARQGNGSSLIYQWYAGTAPATTSPISGATTATYTTPPLNAGASYWVKVTRVVDGVKVVANSTTATVSLGSAPSIVTHPASVTLITGASATLNVEAAGTSPAFQWYEGPAGDTSSPLAGATQSVFTTPALTTTTHYWVRASNALGSADSSAAVLTVAAPDPFAEWLVSKFDPGQIADPAISGQDADPDGDGVKNSDEYVFGTQPLVADASNLATITAPDNGHVAVTFTAKAATGSGYDGKTRKYTLETSSKLNGSDWIPVDGFTDLVGSGQQVIHSAPILLHTGFYRLRVSLTP